MARFQSCTAMCASARARDVLTHTVRRPVSGNPDNIDVLLDQKFLGDKTGIAADRCALEDEPGHRRAEPTISTYWRRASSSSSRCQSRRRAGHGCGRAATTARYAAPHTATSRRSRRRWLRSRRAGDGNRLGQTGGLSASPAGSEHLVSEHPASCAPRCFAAPIGNKCANAISGDEPDGEPDQSIARASQSSVMVRQRR
jgi:hypothetical protein